MEIDQQQVLNLLGQGGFSGVLLFLLWKIGTRMVAALDRLTSSVTAHHQTDTAHHAEVSSDLAEIKGALNIGHPTPRPRLTPPVGMPLVSAPKDSES